MVKNTWVGMDFSDQTSDMKRLVLKLRYLKEAAIRWEQNRKKDLYKELMDVEEELGIYYADCKSRYFPPNILERVKLLEKTMTHCLLMEEESMRIKSWDIWLKLGD